MTGEDYRELRDELHFTQLELANALGIYPSTVARRERFGVISAEAEVAIRSLVPAKRTVRTGEG